MYNQILIGLEALDTDIAFVTEHDILYSPTHFDFRPVFNSHYFFNNNVWRWDYPNDRLITYESLWSVSGMCASRQLLINNYRARIDYVEEHDLPDGHDPVWARRWGYEPGKSTKRGGFKDEPSTSWKSEYPNIDIRHSRTLTPRKVTLESFVHRPADFHEATLDEIPGWNLKEMFDLCTTSPS